MPPSEQDIDYSTAYTKYVERFDRRFGERSVGAFVKFGRAMVQKLAPADFKKRLDEYVRLHRACKRMIETGSTISDALVLDFQDAAAWVVVEAPNIHAMFRGEMADPRIAAPSLRDTVDETKRELDLAQTQLDLVGPKTEPRIEVAALSGESRIDAAPNSTEPRIELEFDDETHKGPIR